MPNSHGKNHMQTKKYDVTLNKDYMYYAIFHFKQRILHEWSFHMINQAFGKFNKFHMK